MHANLREWKTAANLTSALRARVEQRVGAFRVVGIAPSCRPRISGCALRRRQRGQTEPPPGASVSLRFCRRLAVEFVPGEPGQGGVVTGWRLRGHARLASAYRSILLQAIHLHCAARFQKNRRSCAVSVGQAHKYFFYWQTRLLHARPPPLVDVNSGEEAESILCCFGLFVNLVNQESRERTRGRTGYSVRFRGR